MNLAVLFFKGYHMCLYYFSTDFGIHVSGLINTTHFHTTRVTYSTCVLLRGIKHLDSLDSSLWCPRSYKKPVSASHVQINPICLDHCSQSSAINWLNFQSAHSSILSFQAKAASNVCQCHFVRPFPIHRAA